MYSTQQFLDTLHKEFHIINHLASKLTETEVSYRPSQGQRSTLELLQYLSVTFGITARVIATGDQSIYSTFSEESQKTTLENFSTRMDVQLAEIKTLILGLSPETLESPLELFGQGPKPKAVYLVEFLLGWATAYKMQLFLYMKAHGHPTLGTMNLWAGMDAPAPEQD